MKCLKINETIRLRKLDQFNVILEELEEVQKKETGEIKKEWQLKGYYGKIEDSLVRIFEKRLFDSIGQGLTLKKLATTIENAKKDIIETCKELRLNALIK